MTFTDPAARASLFARVQGMILRPNAEWDVVEQESSTTRGVITGYAAPLAAITPICSAIGMTVFGIGAFGVVVRTSPVAALVNAIVAFVLALVSVFVLGLIIEALAPTFGGTKSRLQAMKVAVYGSTAAWVGGVFQIVPALGILSLLMSLYSLYLLYLGLPKLMKTTKEQALGYTALVVVAAIVLAIVVGAVVAGIGATAGFGAGRLGAYGAATPASTVTVNGSTVDVAGMQAASARMAAQVGAIQAQAAAASVGANGETVAVGGPTIAPDALKALLPGAVNGFTRGETSAESVGAGGMNASHAQAVYTRGDARITLEVSDAGAMGTLAGLAGAMGVNSSKETATGYEKVSTANGRMVTEEFDRQSRHGKYAVMAGRVVVTAEGEGASMDEIKAAASSVDTGRVASLAKG